MSFCAASGTIVPKKSDSPKCRRTSTSGSVLPTKRTRSFPAVTNSRYRASRSRCCRVGTSPYSGSQRSINSRTISTAPL